MKSSIAVLNNNTTEYWNIMGTALKCYAILNYKNIEDWSEIWLLKCTENNDGTEILKSYMPESHHCVLGKSKFPLNVSN